MPVQPIIYGDFAGQLGINAHADSQDLEYPSNQNGSVYLPTRTIVGDVETLLGRATGGQDTINSSAIGASEAVGDALLRGVGLNQLSAHDFVFHA
jgi:hypothetical protein